MSEDGISNPEQARECRSRNWHAPSTVIGRSAGRLIVLIVMVLTGVACQATRLPNIAAPPTAVPRETTNADTEAQTRQDALGTAQQDPAPSTESGTPDVLPYPAEAQAPLRGHVIGAANAPVTLIEYSDFQCPYCRQFHRATYPQIDEAYIKTGKVKFVYMHYAVLGQGSVWAAQAAECAGDQGKFWEFHNLLFSNRGSRSKDSLIEMAEPLKLDRKAFADCLNNDATLDRVQRDEEEGDSAGVLGVPYFLVNGEAISGAAPYETFQDAIEQALKSQ